MEAINVSFGTGQAGNQRIKENNRVRRTALDKYFNRDSRGGYFGKQAEPDSPEVIARLQKAEADRIKQERAFLLRLGLIFALVVGGMAVLIGFNLL